MNQSELLDQFEYALDSFISYLYASLTKQSDRYFNSSDNSSDLPQPACSVEEEYGTKKIPKNVFEKDLSIFQKLIIEIKEGANFPYKTRGKRNTFVSIKVHPDLPCYISNISEKHTKHAIYESTFDINIEKVDVTRIIPVLFVFDKNLQNGELELLGVHYVELQKGKFVDEKYTIYQDEWIDIYSKENRQYGGSVKLSIYFDEAKPKPKEIEEEPLNDPNKRNRKMKTKPDIIKEDKEVQTDEYFEEIPVEKLENKNGEISFANLHNKQSRFVFYEEDDLVKDDFIVKSEYEKIDIEKLLFQDEVDTSLINQLEPLIQYEKIEQMERIFNPENDEPDAELFNERKQIQLDEMKNEIQRKLLDYDSEKYSSYMKYKWDYGFYPEEIECVNTIYQDF